MEEVSVFEAHASYVIDLLFTADSKTLISAGMDNVITLWSVQTWEKQSSFKGHQKSVNALALTPDETVLASGSSDQTVKLWSFPQGNLLTTLQDRKQVVASVKISPDGQWVAAGSYGGRVAIWSTEGEPIQGFKANKKNLGPIAFSQDSSLLATGGLGDDIQLWSLPSGDEAATLHGHKTAVTSLQFLKDGQHLVSMGYEGSVRFWELEEHKPVRTIELDRPGVRAFLLSPDEKSIALSMESAVQLRNLGSWTLENELPISTKSVSSMAFSPDGKWFAVGGADRKIRIWAR